MDLMENLQKMALLIDRANEFIEANAPQMLPQSKTKLIDFCTISLMGYEDHLFHWDHLKQIATEQVGRYINNTPNWTIDLVKSTREKVVVRDRSGRHELSMPIDMFMLTTTMATH